MPRAQEEAPSCLPPPLYVFPPRNKVSRTRYRKTYPFHSHHNNMQNTCPFMQGTRVWCPSSGRGPAPRKDEPQSFQNTRPHLAGGEGQRMCPQQKLTLALASTSCASPPCPQWFSLTKGAAPPRGPRPPCSSTGVQGCRLPGANAPGTGLPSRRSRVKQ